MVDSNGAGDTSVGAQTLAIDYMSSNCSFAPNGSRKAQKRGRKGHPLRLPTAYVIQTYFSASSSPAPVRSISRRPHQSLAA